MVKKVRVTIFRELNFRFRDHPRKFITVHRENLSCEYGRALCVRGYHVYREIWEAAVGLVLICERGPRLPISARTLVLYLL